MRKLIVFNHVSMDGFFVDAKGGMSWAKSDRNDAEWKSFVEDNARGDGPLLFGRITYELMASFWPTPMADNHDPSLAKRMNTLPKVVFSTTLEKAHWNNTKLVKGDLLTEVKKMKQEPGEGMAILGSGTIVSQLAQAGLIDEYQIAMNPIILGEGRTMFEGVGHKLNLKLTKSRSFENGNIVMWYEPVA